MNFEKLKKNIISFLSSSKILNNLPDMVLYVDSDGIIKESNTCAKNNLGVTENITINELFIDGMNAIMKSVKTKKSVLLESRSNDEYLELFASKVGCDYCVSVRDNTKIINDTYQNNGIERFNNEKNALIVKLENEIKSPLNSITGFCQGLVEGIGGEVTDKQSKYLKIIQSNSNDLAAFLNAFSDFSYAESLLYEADFKKFDIVIEIKNILKEILKSYPAINLNHDLYYEGLEERNIYADYKAITKSITHIIENSLAMSGIEDNLQIIISKPDDESFISYGLEEGKKYIQIKIKDDNSAIEPKDLKYICNPYSQTDKGRKNIIRSFRLGTVSILIKRAGGFFGISSQSGNLYNIIIPVEKEEYE